MANVVFRLTLVFFLSLFAFTAQTTGIYISSSSTFAGETASSWESFSLDDSTSLCESQLLSAGSISTNRQAEGKGNNSLRQTLSGSDYVIENDVEIQGEFRAFTDSSVSAQSAALNQNVGGIGDMSLELQGREGATDAVQEARVEGGLLHSQHSLSAGEGITASQSTLIEGQKGSILAGALGKDNVMVARGDFEGLGCMKAELESTTKGRASTMGTAYIDGAQVLNDKTFKAVRANGLSQGMAVSGLRMVEGGLGDFDVSVVNIDWAAEGSNSYATEKKVDDSAKPRGSSSSYALTGFRWNQMNPNIQLYLNPSDVPSGIKVESAQRAITDAANTWDEAVAPSLFVDESTVIIDDGKKVVNPFSDDYKPDGINLNGFMSLGNYYLALTALWTDLSKRDGYYSIIESDIVYNLDFKWTDDEKQARNTGKLDLQSVALHELGHTIGLGDLYTLNDGDVRKYDLDQVMNLYDGPQRTLGNGDLAGVQEMYGSKVSAVTPVNLYRLYGYGDHFYTTSKEEKQIAESLGYLYEGIAGLIYPNQIQDTVPLYRLYGLGDHYYTAKVAHKEAAESVGYKYEGVTGYIYLTAEQGLKPFWSLYGYGDHFYTIRELDRQVAESVGFKYEGIIGYIEYDKAIKY